MTIISNCVFKLYFFLYLQMWKSNIYKEECEMSYHGLEGENK